MAKKKKKASGKVRVGKVDKKGVYLVSIPASPALAEGLEVEASSEEEAKEKFFEQNGIISTVHPVSVRSAWDFEEQEVG